MEFSCLFITIDSGCVTIIDLEDRGDFNTRQVILSEII